MKATTRERQKRILEDAFFARQEKELLARLREQRAHTATREALAEASGITDEAVLDRLVELEIHAETLTALVLVPLVEVAWADGTLDDREREAILDAAAAEGLDRDSNAHELLLRWLRTPPEPALLDSWKEYVAAIGGEMPREALEALRDRLLGQARVVAEAAGGFLGRMTVSLAEKDMLEDLASAFPP